MPRTCKRKQTRTTNVVPGYLFQFQLAIRAMRGVVFLHGFSALVLTVLNDDGTLLYVPVLCVFVPLRILGKCMTPSARYTHVNILQVTGAQARVYKLMLLSLSSLS